MDEMKYTAFISYRHGGKDEYAARMLHRQLESYRVPAAAAGKTGKTGIGRIFRDVDELPSSDSLYDNIEEALKQSRYLIVICTPRLKESQWCMREIELFVKLRGADSVFAVLADGEPAESFPEILTQREVNGACTFVEPLAADIRGNTKLQVLRKIRTERLRLIAAMLDCEFDQLRQRARIRARIRNGVAIGTAAAVALAFIGMISAENVRLQSQVRQTQVAQSYLLSQYSTACFQGDDPLTAALLALEALPNNLGEERPFVGDPMAALTTALQTYNYQKGYMADHKIAAETMDRVFMSPDGAWLAYTDLNHNETYHLHFYDTSKNEEAAAFEVNGDYYSEACADSKAVFFGGHFCAFAGIDGLTVVDTRDFSTMWTGERASSVDINKEETVIAAYDYLGRQVTFYDMQGKKRSKHTWEGSDSLSLGFNAEGSLYARIQRTEETTALLLIDPESGAVKTDLAQRFPKDQQQYLASCTTDCAWTGDLLVFGSKTAEEDPLFYSWYDAKTDRQAVTELKLAGNLIRLDGEENLAAFCFGTELSEVDLHTGEILKSYIAPGRIASAVSCGNDRYEAMLADGTLEYLDFADVPYCISSMKGDGTGISSMSVGGDYMAAFLTNAYQVQLYRLNDKTADLTGSLPRRGSEINMLVGRKDNLILLNTTDNTYGVDADTLHVTTFPSPNSYMIPGDSSTAVEDDYEGTYTLYRADDGSKKAELPSSAALFSEFACNLDSERQVLVTLSYETGEVLQEYPVPETCTSAWLLQEKLITVCEEGEDQVLEIHDRKGGEALLSEKVDECFIDEGVFVYLPAGSEDYVVYDLQNGKEAFSYPFGTIDWCSPGVDNEYLFISTSDNGGFILDGASGTLLLTLPDVSTVQDMICYADNPCFGLLYIEKSGETRLDVYEKENPDSPIAVIPGGIGMNRNNQALIYDGTGTIYAAEIQSKEELYRQGLAFVGNAALTDRQRKEYHCQ